MSQSTFDTFERYKRKGLDARRAGQWESARIYLLQAARSIMDLSKAAMDPELRDARRQMAERLLELARDCDRAATEKRSPDKRSFRGGTQQRSKSSAPGSASAASSAYRASDADGDGTDASNWMVKERPRIRFDDVAGLDEVKEEIRLKMLYPFEHPDLAERFGLRAGGGLLLYGPPGTGKTMLAKATAGEIDAAFFRVSPADIMSKWVGEAEQNIQKLFDAAAAETRAIIFIDEIEALVPARQDAGQSVMQRVVPQILQAMEGFDKDGAKPILFMGATNVPWQLDPAVLRPGRFDEKVYIPLPDLAARRKLLELYLSDRPLADDIDLESLATRLDGYSGADVKYICDRAATIPFMRSIATGKEGAIDAAAVDDALADTKKSVTPEMERKFAEWAERA